MAAGDEKKKVPKSKRDKVKFPVADLIPAEIVIPVSGKSVEFRKLFEIAELIWLPSNLDEEQRNARIIRAIELYEGLKPKGSAEGMLAIQMVGTHSMALECLRRASLENQSFEGRDQNLKLAQKLMALFAQQMATLDKHRGKGQQKVTVEYVNVEPGAQAIVGNVETGSGGTETKQSPKALENSNEPTVDDILESADSNKKAKVRRRK